MKEFRQKHTIECMYWNYESFFVDGFFFPPPMTPKQC